MRIVIDMQGAQSESRCRGIGRYSLSLSLAIARNAGEHEIWLAVSAAFPDSIPDIRHAFIGLVPPERIRVFDIPKPVAERTESLNTWRIQAAEIIREHFLEQLRPDIVLLTSLFEGYDDDAVTSIRASHEINTAVILYDLIPLLSPATYLTTHVLRRHYNRKIHSLKSAGLLLSISDYSRQEAIDAINVSPNNVTSISTAADTRFQPKSLPSEDVLLLRQRYGFTKKLVMYAPGGFDPRKNFDGLLNAYALLPAAVRVKHQLIIVSKISEEMRAQLQCWREQAGLAERELVLTDYVPDDDLVALYNLATLFIFPSKHEGFGLPVLEAMACGVPVIGSNTTSIPEVIGWDEALFDPASSQSIANKMLQFLTDDDLRKKAREHGLKQAKTFSWDTSAKRAIAALEQFQASKKRSQPALLVRRPKLAYVSPLPPERSGISDYSAELLPELSRHYDIDVIIAQDTVSDPWIKANCAQRSVAWFKAHANQYERVLYHFGNSHFHQHMFGLLEQVPGVVVLHDFFLSGVAYHMDDTHYRPNFLAQTFYQSHGYAVVQQLFHAPNTMIVLQDYPGNLSVIQNALGVVVHAEHPRHLANQWYGEGSGDSWAVLSLLRMPVCDIDRHAARRALQLAEDDFVVCSFGLLGPAKLNHRLLDAWLASSLAQNTHCVLVFVGENNGGDYGAELLHTIRRSGLDNRIRITGWTDTETFRSYLAAADMGVQLRSLSRGETSAAVLDCMNYGLATIVNAHGSMVGLPTDAVWMLPDEFTDAELVSALETLWRDAEYRRQLSSRAQALIRTAHKPSLCADQYAQAIEAFYQPAKTSQAALFKAIAAIDNSLISDIDLRRTAQSIAISCPPHPLQRQLLVDVSNIVQNDLKTGIERVVRAQLLALMEAPPTGFRVEPVYLTEQGGQSRYQYARGYACRLLDVPAGAFTDEPVDIARGDVFYAADFSPSGVMDAANAGIYAQWQAIGVSIVFLVYDLLPIKHPQFFPEGASTVHTAWLSKITEIADQIICISHTVADELRAEIKSRGLAHKSALRIDGFHLGSDIAVSVPTTGMPSGARFMLKKMQATPCFLMVGTIEPRKGCLQVLASFEQLWQQGQKIGLVIVGHEGWKSLPDDQRRTIPQIIQRICHHPELGKRLFWLNGVSDEYLEKVYAASICLIAASEAEGFGLPLIEAAQHKLPIIARDIPVFREVAGEHAFYFSGLEPDALAESVKNWLALHADGKCPLSDGMPYLTWQQSAQQLISHIL